jgi:hypothetical protein
MIKLYSKGKFSIDGSMCITIPDDEMDRLIQEQRDAYEKGELYFDVEVVLPKCYLMNQKITWINPE